MFQKQAKYILSDFVALNTPKFVLSANYLKHKLSVDKSLVEYTIKKIASLNSKTADQDKEAKQTESELILDGDNTKFDLEAEIKSHPDSLFVKCFAIKADEPNDNGDYFSKEELKKSYGTFVGVPVFTNHQNTDINEARGKVVYSWWDEDRNGIMVIMRVDAVAYPQLARGISERYVVGTSMGTQVAYSICSVCHNYAEVPDHYCSDIKERKTRKISQKNVKCQYHKRGSLEKCPICNSTKDDPKKFDVEDQKVFEYNYGMRFIENSLVVNPACRDCGITEIIDPSSFLSKVAELSERLPVMMKNAKESPFICTDKTCISLVGDKEEEVIKQALEVARQGAAYVAYYMSKQGSNFVAAITKEAGQKELQDLNQALDLMTSVSQSMLQQKDQLDLEFLSDLIQVVADLQGVTDELNEQGYGRLQSPGQQPVQPGTEQTAQPQPAQPGLAPTNPTPTPGGSNILNGPTNAGTVTTPTAANTKKFYLDKYSKDILHPQIKAIQKEMKKSGFDFKFKLNPLKKMNFGFKLRNNKDF